MNPRKDSRWSHAMWWERNIDVPGNGICLPYTLSQSQSHKQEVFLSPIQVKYFTSIYAEALRLICQVLRKKIPNAHKVCWIISYMRGHFACIYFCITCGPDAGKGQKRVLVCEHWDSNPGPLGEKSVLLSPGPSLWSLLIVWAWPLLYYLVLVCLLTRMFV